MLPSPTLSLLESCSSHQLIAALVLLLRELYTARAWAAAHHPAALKRGGVLQGAELMDDLREALKEALEIDEEVPAPLMRSSSVSRWLSIGKGKPAPPGTSALDSSRLAPLLIRAIETLSFGYASEAVVDHTCRYRVSKHAQSRIDTLMRAVNIAPPAGTKPEYERRQGSLDFLREAYRIRLAVPGMDVGDEEAYTLAVMDLHFTLEVFASVSSFSLLVDARTLFRCGETRRSVS